MSDGRWGPTRTSRLLINLTYRPELEEAVFLDLTEAGPMASYPLAEVVDERSSPMDVQPGVSLASRLIVRDAPLAGLPPELKEEFKWGPSP